MTFPELLAALVVYVAFPAVWTVVFLLVRLTRKRPELLVLRERAIVAFAVALNVTVFAFIFVNNDQDTPWLSPDETRVLTRATILLTALVPSAYFLWFIYVRQWIGEQRDK